MTTPNRRSFLKYAGVGAGALTLGGLNLSALAATSPSTKSVQQDITILQYALVLEYLEAEFYGAFTGSGGFAGKLMEPRVREYAKELADHEQKHVDALIATIKKLGGTPNAKPNIDFGPLIGDGSGLNDQAFLKLAATFEPIGVRAYLGQAPSVQNAEVLTAAASILAVEANHTSGIQELRRQMGYVSGIVTNQTGIAPQPGTNDAETDTSKFDVSYSPVPTAFWKPLSMETVLKIVGPLIKSS